MAGLMTNTVCYSMVFTPLTWCYSRQRESLVCSGTGIEHLGGGGHQNGYIFGNECVDVEDRRTWKHLLCKNLRPLGTGVVM